MSWFGGFFTGVSMSINAAFCLVIDKLANERDDLRKQLKSNKRNDNAEYRRGYQAGQKDSIHDIFDSIMYRLHIEEDVEDTKQYMATILNDMSKEQLEVVTLLVAQALKETPERTSKNTITVDLDDAINNGPAKLISEFETLSINDNPLNVDVNILTGGSKLMDISATFNFSEDPETLSKFNDLIDDFVNIDPEEFINRWTEGFLANESDISDIAHQQANDILVNEMTDETNADSDNQPLEMM